MRKSRLFTAFYVMDINIGSRWDNLVKRPFPFYERKRNNASTNKRQPLIQDTSP